MSDRFEIIPFEDRTILTVRTTGDGIHVVMKPIVEALGLAWNAQLERIKRHPVIGKGMRVTRIPSAGGVQDATTLELEQFHGWLLTLSPDRITDGEKREIIIQYQERAFRVIFEHFHGRMDSGPTSASSMSARVILQNQSLRIAQKLRTTRNRVERRMMHEMLTGMCSELGITTPALDELGHDAPEAPDILLNFWGAVDVLRGRGFAIDHSRNPQMLALSLSEMSPMFEEVGIHIILDRTLRKALRLSEEPRYVSNKAVNSKITGTSKNCWVFEVNPAAAAPEPYMPIAAPSTQRPKRQAVTPQAELPLQPEADGADEHSKG
jgi:hypothetical protein